MAAPYNTQASGTIGTLLRQIQEEKSESPLLKTPQAIPGSPIREIAQQPVFQPEAPDSSRVASIRPETAPIDAGSAENQVVPPTYAPPEAPVVGPAEAGFGPPTSAAPSTGGPQVAPSAQPARNTAAPAVKSVGIGTRISPQVIAKASAPVKTVASAAKAPMPSPTPAPQKAPGSLRFGQAALTAAPLGQRLLPALEDILGLAKNIGGRILGGDSLAKIVTGTSLLSPKPVGGDISPNRKVAGRK